MAKFESKETNKYLNWDAIINVIQESTVRKKSEVSFIVTGYQDALNIMPTFIDFDIRVPELEKRILIKSSVANVSKHGTLTKERLFKEINRLEELYLKKVEKEFVLVSSISLKSPPAIKSRKHQGALLLFRHSLPSTFERHPSTMFRKQYRENIEAAQGCLYTSVRVYVKAKVESEAVVAALDILNFQRSIWNFCINVKRRNRLFPTYGMVVEDPVNLIRLGPVHTLHEKNGSLSTFQYWCEDGFFKPVKTMNQIAFNPTIIKQEKTIKRLLKKKPYFRKLEEALVRYSTALDSNELETSFLKLWGVLEFLTGTVGGSYDQTIRRVTFLHKGSDYHKCVLGHLKIKRNAIVHSGEDFKNDIGTLYQIKRYAEDLISFHLFTNFNTIEEVGNFLGLTTDKAGLKKRAKECEYALKLLK